MIRYLIIFPVLLFATIFGIGIYLQPNNLSGCNGQISQVAPCQPVDAIIVVSGGDTNARTDKAIELYKDGWSNKLIFSGAAEDKLGPSNAAVMEKRAETAGIPKSMIYVDESSETTHQNAANVQTILTYHNIHSVILVTSGYHQRRANLEFSKLVPNISIKNDPVANDRDWSIWWWTGPRGWTLAVTELFKIILFYFGVGQ
jgi:uncharacterized SAM-binding protein YcdF (DUF218 family)